MESKIKFDLNELFYMEDIDVQIDDIVTTFEGDCIRVDAYFTNDTEYHGLCRLYDDKIEQIEAIEGMIVEYVKEQFEVL